MNNKVMVIILILMSITCQSAEISKFGINYGKLTRNDLLTKLMLDLEPKLISAYQEYGLNDKQQKRGIRGMATALGNDKPIKALFNG